MAQQTRSYLKGKLAQSGARPVAQDMSDMIDSFMQPGDAISAEQIPDETVGAVADKVMNDADFQAQFGVNKVDNIDNPNSDDVVTSKGVADAVATPFTNDFFDTI